MSKIEPVGQGHDPEKQTETVRNSYSGNFCDEMKRIAGRKQVCRHTRAASDVPFDEVLLRMMQMAGKRWREFRFIKTGSWMWAGIAIPIVVAVCLAVLV